MKYFIQRVAFGAIVITILLTSIGARQSITGWTLVAMAQETDDPVKIEVYTRFFNNWKTNEAVAYQAAKEYLQKYPKDNDQYTQYLQKWIVIYERDQRKRTLPQLIYNAKNFAGAFFVFAKVAAIIRRGRSDGELVPRRLYLTKH